MHLRRALLLLPGSMRPESADVILFGAKCKAYSGTRMIEEASKMFQQIEGAPVPLEAVVDLIQAKLGQLGLIQDDGNVSPPVPAQRIDAAIRLPEKHL